MKFWFYNNSIPSGLFAREAYFQWGSRRRAVCSRCYYSIIVASIDDWLIEIYNPEGMVGL